MNKIVVTMVVTGALAAFVVWWFRRENERVDAGGSFL